MEQVNGIIILTATLAGTCIGLIGGLVIGRILRSPINSFKPALTPYDRMVADRVKSN
jgi:hypothetical protein